MKRYYIVYEGIVQGVGFRGKIIQIARRNRLTGFVRNMDNGNVECEVQGENIDPFLTESLKNDYFARVYDYSIREIPPVEDEETFRVRF